MVYGCRFYPGECFKRVGAPQVVRGEVDAGGESLGLGDLIADLDQTATAESHQKMLRRPITHLQRLDRYHRAGRRKLRRQIDLLPQETLEYVVGHMTNLQRTLVP
jgi:hypothetical protein